MTDSTKLNGFSSSTASLGWELPRAFLEAGNLACLWPLLVRRVPLGDGHPVLVLPGFLGGDESTFVLRRFLVRIGYRALPWLRGRNTGKPKLLTETAKRLLRGHQVSGERISIVGQSLGGVYARQIARAHPEAVRCVITLGSPFAADDVEHAAIPLVRELFTMLAGDSAEAMREKMVANDDPEVPLAVPSTAIYSKSDGVAAWRACRERESERAENIEVRASHSGMAVNPDILYAIADRLAQDPEDWRRFDRTQGLRRWIYPAASPS